MDVIPDRAGRTAAGRAPGPAEGWAPARPSATARQPRPARRYQGPCRWGAPSTRWPGRTSPSRDPTPSRRPSLHRPRARVLRRGRRRRAERRPGAPPARRRTTANQPESGQRGTGTTVVTIAGRWSRRVAGAAGCRAGRARAPGTRRCDPGTRTRPGRGPPRRAARSVPHGERPGPRRPTAPPVLQSGQHEMGAVVAGDRQQSVGHLLPEQPEAAPAGSRPSGRCGVDGVARRHEFGEDVALRTGVDGTETGAGDRRGRRAVVGHQHVVPGRAQRPRERDGGEVETGAGTPIMRTLM